MNTNIAGIFDSRIQAENVIAELERRGFDHDDISLILSKEAQQRLFYKTDDEAERAAKGGAAGAVIGGALGALLVGLSVITGIAVPGMGLLAAGPIVAAISAGTAGATVMGLGGALIESGFAADEANRFEEEVKAGKAVVIVHAGDAARADLARAVFNNSGASTQAA